MFEHYHHSYKCRTTADSQEGQKKTALQETWVGPRQPAASLQSSYVTSLK